jgi:flagellar biogenesis protein FliO
MKAYLCRAVLLTLACACLPALAQQAAPIPFKQDSAGDALAVSATTALALCGLLGLGAVVLVRKRRPAGQAKARAVVLLESQRLSARTSVHVLQFGAHRYLLTEHAQGVACIASTAQAGAPAKENT